MFLSLSRIETQSTRSELTPGNNFIADMQQLEELCSDDRNSLFDWQLSLEPGQRFGTDACKKPS